MKKLWVIKSTRDKSLIRLLKSPGTMISASGVSSSHKKSISKTRFLSSCPNELCNRLKVLPQEKQAGNKETGNEEIGNCCYSK